MLVVVVVVADETFAWCVTFVNRWLCFVFLPGTVLAVLFFG